MIENGKIEIINSGFIYDHKRAIEGIKDNEIAYTLITITNTYLKSLLEFLNAETFRFVEKGIIYSDHERIDLNKTDSIIIGYYYKNKNKYFKKILIQNNYKVAKNNGLIEVESNG